MRSSFLACLVLLVLAACATAGPLRERFSGRKSCPPGGCDVQLVVPGSAADPAPKTVVAPPPTAAPLEVQSAPATPKRQGPVIRVIRWLLHPFGGC